MSVAFATGGGWTGGRDAANRETEIRPEAFQGPVPSCLLGAPDRPMQPSPKHSPARPNNTMQSPVKRVLSRGFPTREEREAARKRAEAEAAPVTSQALPCPACAGPAKKNGYYPSGERRWRCKAKACGRNWGGTPKPAKPSGPPCPHCGSPSWGHGRSALGVPIRHCPACRKHWVTVRKTGRAYNGFSTTRAASARAAWAKRSPEERREMGRAAAAKRLASQSHESRSAASRKGAMALSAAKRVERARKGAAMLHSRSPEKKAARIAKMVETKRLKKRSRAAARVAASEVVGLPESAERVNARPTLTVEHGGARGSDNLT